MAINPAKYLSVLKKASDQQLFQMLQRPDQIPTMFVQQEIARRNRSRVSAKAQLNQMANQMANSQKPMLPVTQTPPQDQSLYAQTGGDGITRMKPGGLVTPRGDRRRVGGGTDGTGMPKSSEIYAFMAESGRAVGKLDDTKEANLMAWLTNKKNKPRNLGDVEKVINWLDQGIIQPKAGNAKKIRAFANQILNENNYDPRESGGSLYRGFVRETAENVPPLFEKGLNLIKKLGAGAEKVIFGEDGFEGFKDNVKRSLELEAGNVFNEENPPPTDAVDQAINESGAMKAQEFKMLEEADQPRPQDFLPMMEAERARANRSAMADASRYQGLADYYADKEARRMDGFRKAQQMKGIETLEDRALANYNPNMDETNRLRDVESQRLTAMANDPLQTVILDGNRVARLPDQNPDLRRAEIEELQNRGMPRVSASFSPQYGDPQEKFAYGKPRSRELERLRMEGINAIPANRIDTSNMPTGWDKTWAGIKNIGTALRENIDNTFGIYRGKDGNVYNKKGELLNPNETILEALNYSPPETEKFVPPESKGISSLDQKVKDTWNERLKQEAKMHNRVANMFEPRLERAKRMRDLALTTNYGDNRPFDVGDENLDAEQTQDFINKERDRANFIQGELDKGGFNPSDYELRRFRKQGIDTIYDADGKLQTPYDYSNQKTELARIMEGQAFGQDYLKPISPELQKEIDAVKKIEDPALLGTFDKIPEPNPNYGKPQDWKAREEAMFIPDYLNNENQLKYEEASGAGTLFGSDKDQSSQEKPTQNDRESADPKEANKDIEELIGDGSKSGDGKGDGSTSNTGIAGVASQQLSDLTKAQDKLLEAMKPQKDAYSRFWGLVSDFGANIAASDKVGFINAAGEAMRATMDTLQGINKEDRDKFIESAKMAVEFEADKRDFALKIANANASAGRSNRAHELALKRLGLDMKEYNLSKLTARSKALTDQLKNLNPADLNYDEQTANINSAINDNNKQILLLDNDLVYEDGQLTST